MVPIKDIMTNDVITVKPDTPIYEALHILTENKISGVPVIDKKENIIGVLSEKDVLCILIDKDLKVQKKVEDYMSRNVITFSEEDSAVKICEFFYKSNVRRAPIVKDGKLVGIVSRRDIVKLILEAQSKISDFRYL